MTAKVMLAMSKPQISKFICELRSKTNLTQEQLAAQLGVTFSSVSRWERGLSKPSPLAIQQIEGMLQQMGDRGRELVERCLVE